MDRYARGGWGRSLGVNVLPPAVKVCKMNYAYCQHGSARRERARMTRRPAWPSAARVGTAITARLLEAARTGESIDRITVAGHGEPTLHPAFEEIIEGSSTSAIGWRRIPTDVFASTPETRRARSSRA